MAKRDQTALVQLKVRMREPLRARMEQDAKRRGVSINAEIVDRLERSLDRADLLPEVMSLNYGEELAGVLMFLGTVMIWADAFHRVDNSQPRGPSHKWMWAPDADAYDQSVRGAVAVLEAMRPDEPVIAHSNAGEEMANTIIKAVRGDPDGESGFAHDAPTIRALLGPIAERMARKELARNAVSGSKAGPVNKRSGSLRLHRSTTGEILPTRREKINRRKAEK